MVFFDCLTNIIGVLLITSNVFITKLQIKVYLVLKLCRQYIKLFLREKCSFDNITV